MSSCDVLILGHGLAGLRAGIAALTLDPSLKVVIAAPVSGPTGSSFAGPHSRLGMQVLFPDQDPKPLSRTVFNAARPGFVDPALVEVLLTESHARYLDLVEFGGRFITGPDSNEPRRYPGCFTPGLDSAVILENTHQLHQVMQQRFLDLGGLTMTGTVSGILDLEVSRAGRQVVGAAMTSATGEATWVGAGAVVAALGGPAPLWGRSFTGAHNTGTSYALLHRCGARLANAGFVQFLWAQLSDFSFWSPAWLFRPGVRVLPAPGSSQAEPLAPPLKLELLAAPRSSHAPAAYHLADSALDAWLWRRGDDTGVTRIQDPTHGDAAIAPMAQAGNGGAVIDEFGRTTVSGLLAAGECATGMHGANRLGGAMVTATQVFGARAGMVAAEDASAGPQPRESEVRAAFDAFMGRGVVHDPKERTDVLSWLGTILSTHALDLDRAASAELAAATDKRLAHTSDHHARLALETAGLILSGRLEAAAAGADQEPAPHAGAAPGDS